MDFYVDDFPPVHYLDASQAFEALNEKERKYVYACYEASWIGGLIDLIQTSPESAGIFLLIQKVFRKQSPHSFSEHAKSCGFTDREIEATLSYFACVCGNLGNYKSFGDTKFIPAVPQSRLSQLLATTVAFNDRNTNAAAIFDEICPSIYSLSTRLLKLGFGPEEGITTYYSSDCTKADAEAVQVYLTSAKLEAYNTRLFKEPGSMGAKKTVSLRLASADDHIVEINDAQGIPSDWLLRLEYGDMKELMSLLVKSSLSASLQALNPGESEMWKLYAESFKTGSIDKHKEASIVWIKDKCPEVETYIGFIESYRDPFGVRGEFEAFVAVVNKVVSAKFGLLVDDAVSILPNLPWPSTYERQTFTKPDFTSLDVLTFATSGAPIGINIPNYDEIRESIGFKNVSLGNVIAARLKDPKTEFILDTDRSVYMANVGLALDIQVGLHELLGHGSGKLFRRNEDGSFNFDRNGTEDLLTGKQIEQWYEPGETWDSKFGILSSSMEECRAECVGIYLCDLPAVLKIFGVTPSHATSDVPDVVYVNWLSMVRSGVMSMEFYTPPKNSGDSGTWRQAHSWARYAILRVLLEADPTLVRIETSQASDGAPDLAIHFDRAKVLTVAKPAIGEFLTKLQYYKSVGNVKDGSAFFARYTELTPEHLAIRKIVLNRKRPRPILVQPHFRLNSSGNLEMVAYPPTHSGLIQSFIDRFAELPLGEAALAALETIWRRDQPYFKDIQL